jgi:hypothetical protein
MFFLIIWIFTNRRHIYISPKDNKLNKSYNYVEIKFFSTFFSGSQFVPVLLITDPVRIQVVKKFTEPDPEHCIKHLTTNFFYKFRGLLVSRK